MCFSFSWLETLARTITAAEELYWSMCRYVDLCFCIRQTQEMRKDDAQKTRGTAQIPRMLLTQGSTLQILKLWFYLDPDISNPKNVSLFLLSALSLKENKLDLLFSYPSQLRVWKMELLVFWELTHPMPQTQSLPQQPSKVGTFFWGGATPESSQTRDGTQDVAVTTLDLLTHCAGLGLKPTPPRSYCNWIFFKGCICIWKFLG